MSKILAFSEATSIAFHNVGIIAISEISVNANALAKSTDSSVHHIAKVMQKLVKDGILKSSRGPKGGFKLARKPQDISLLNIFESINGKVTDNICPTDRNSCPLNCCIFGDIGNKLTHEFTSYFRNYTLQHFIENNYQKLDIIQLPKE